MFRAINRATYGQIRIALWIARRSSTFARPGLERIRSAAVRTATETDFLMRRPRKTCSKGYPESLIWRFPDSLSRLLIASL